MTPTAARAAMHQTHYAVLCDVCHGRRFVHDQLCHKCQGDGQVIIPVERAAKGMSQRNKRFVIAVTAVALAVVAVIFILL